MVDWVVFGHLEDNQKFFHNFYFLFPPSSHPVHLSPIWIDIFPRHRGLALSPRLSSPKSLWMAFTHTLTHTKKKKKSPSHIVIRSPLLYSPPPLPSWAVRWECVFEEGGRGVWGSNVSLDRDPLWGVDVLRLGAPKADWHSAANSLVVYGGTTANVRHAVRPFLHFSLRQLFLPPHANNELCKYLRDIHMQLFQSSPSWSSKAPYCPPLPPLLRHFCMWGSLIGLQWLLAPSGQYAQTGAEPVS